MKDITIEKADIKDIKKVSKILNEVTADLISRGIYQWNYPCDEKALKQDIEEEKVYLVLVEGHPVGTFSLENLGCENNEFYKNLDGKYLYRIAVLPRIQGLGYGQRIFQIIKESYGINQYTLYLDCWSGNEKLKKFYMNAGLKYIGDYPEKDYSISIFKVS